MSSCIILFEWTNRFENFMVLPTVLYFKQTTVLLLHMSLQCNHQSIYMCIKMYLWKTFWAVQSFKESPSHFYFEMLLLLFEQYFFRSIDLCTDNASCRNSWHIALWNVEVVCRSKQFLDWLNSHSTDVGKYAFLSFYAKQ